MQDQSLGQLRLHEMLELDVPKPHVRSTAVRGNRRTIEGQDALIEQFPPRYVPQDTAIEHLKFALRHEPLDMGVLAAAFKAMPKQDIQTWIKSEPTGAVSRRAWFLYEALTGDTLNIEDAAR